MPPRHETSTRIPRKAKYAQSSGLALIERLYFGAGQAAAQEHLQRLLGPDQSTGPYALSESGQAAMGVHFTASDEISLQTFSPPSSWNAAYSLQLVRFGSREKDEYVYHQGEQLLIPVRGAVQYHFFWTPGGRAPDRVMPRPATENTILRINPQIPHHDWAANGEAIAWVVSRHANDSPAALVLDQEAASFTVAQADAKTTIWRSESSHSTLRTANRRRATRADLKKGGAYAMIAWGISDMIRDARQRTGLTTTHLANQVGIDPSSLSRLEEAKANVSIEMLAKVCRKLRVGLADRLDSGSWIYECERIDPKPTVRSEPMLNLPAGPHALHPYLLKLAEGEELLAATGAGPNPNQISSWIILKGKVLFDLPPALGGKPIIADAGNVMHFRKPGNVGTKALQSCTIVQIVHSQVCGCRARSATATA